MLKLLSETSISDMIETILQNAILCQASDIHFEPYANLYRIRFRIQGLLEEMFNPEIHLAERFAARLKIMANLNIAEKRLPQDGHFQFKQGEELIEIRLSTCPTYYGEKVVLRLLNSSFKQLALSELGLEKEQETLLRQAILQAHGLILITGPTGSGKTITLYSLLQELNRIEKNICTVEDPIELHLSGINQVQVNPIIGLEFSNTLKNFLRQDPDVIMVGEIRDQETAEIAVNAAQTGHLVFATLHTPYAKEAFQRLLSFGVNLSCLQSVVKLIIAQRLVRKLCYHCKNLQTKLCKNCHNGYQGRIGIFELYAPAETTYIDLKQAGLLKVSVGLTTLQEIERVL